MIGLILKVKHFKSFNLLILKILIQTIEVSTIVIQQYYIGDPAIATKESNATLIEFINRKGTDRFINLRHRQH
jgi:phage host-nuclease inhibitor protein Gam